MICHSMQLITLVDEFIVDELSYFMKLIILVDEFIVDELLFYAAY
jgi:hypothetical protein